MHPGSGPSDRDNDGYFTPIRQHLLGEGFAVCSFDKRGVGSSTGRWQDAGIVEQADDLLECLAELRAEPDVPRPIGLFGYSQGGWVVVEAAGRAPAIAFVIANSGPGVTPSEQERYAHSTYLVSAGLSGHDLSEALEPYDSIVLPCLRRRATFAELREQINRAVLPASYRESELVLFPDDEELWNFLRQVSDYDPRAALRRIRVPVLALFGAADALVPVERSADAYRDEVAPGLLSLRIFAGADHRLQVGEPPQFADGYFETLSDFISDLTR
jgi:pimeloyl-ACP methyl ester carboxylesterase